MFVCLEYIGHELATNNDGTISYSNNSGQAGIVITAWGIFTGCSMDNYTLDLTG